MEVWQMHRPSCRVRYESFKADIFQSENYTIGDVQSDNCYIGGDGVAEQEFDLLKLTSTNYKSRTGLVTVLFDGGHCNQCD